MNKPIRYILLTVLICIYAPSLYAVPKDVLEAQTRELKILKNYLEEERDSLQEEIKNRWSQKQLFVEQREIDKQSIEELRRKQERSYSNLSRLKEESFSRERILEDKKERLEDKKEDWKIVSNSFKDVFDKESEKIVEKFPVGMEKRRENLEKLKRKYSLHSDPKKMLRPVIDYYIKYINQGSEISSTRHILLPEEGEPEEMKITKFGNVFGYALNNSGVPYIIRQTGNLGTAKYKIEEIEDPEFAQNIQKSISRWSSSGKIKEKVKLDVMQNNNSGILISGKKVTSFDRIKKWLKAGGPLLIPLILMLIWGGVLIIIKLLQYQKSYKNNEKMYHEVIKLFKEGKKEEAYEYAKNCKGVVPKVVEVCLEHTKWSRSVAEKAIREIVIEEVPRLNNHLTTLAVIAGAAPLMGLLGTVTGMIKMFNVITHYGTGDPKILAGGISEALVTTQTGLSVAIPILLIHNFLNNKSILIQNDMQKYAIRILNRLWPKD